MCGIIAQISFSKPIDQKVFDKARDTMIHRGPDGAGSLFFDNNKIALGHRRLSIIDLSLAGKQPMQDQQGNITLSFNGEIYNYQALRKELELKGYIFHSQTDTEVLIHGYKEWGTSMVNHLKGMFAFIIWDDSSQTMFLARDRFGIKPLCYFQNTQSFAAASEIKALIALPEITPSLDPDAISDYFVFRYIPSPKSIWKEIRKLPPAHCMLVKPDTSVEIWRYWNPTFEQNYLEEKEAFDQLEELLSSSVAEHMIADVPVGVLLSGGMDSSAIAYYARNKNPDLNTFALGFKNQPFSEHKDSKLVAKALNCTHHELLIGSDFVSHIQELFHTIDEPIGGTAFLPTYLIHKLASEKVKVVLAGHGGDEVLGGYGWYHSSQSSWVENPRQSLKRLIWGKEKFFYKAAFNSRTWTHWSYKDLPNLLNLDFDETVYKKDDYDLIKPYFNTKASFLKNAQAMDLGLFNNELNMSFLDKTSMAHSIEARVPFLDHQLAEFLTRLNQDLYFQKGNNKILLKRLMLNRLPADILNKPKQGFGFKVRRVFSPVEIEKQIRSSYCFSESGIFSQRLKQQDFNSLLSAQLWSIYVFCKWFDKWAV